MGLIESTIEQLRQRRRDAHERAVQAYRALLLRADAPLVGDEDQLIGCMRELGRGPADLAVDAERARRLDQAEKLAAKLDALRIEAERKHLE